MNGQCGLIFDMDGLIADTEPLNARVTIRIFEDKFNVRGVKPSDFAAGIGKGAEAYIKAGARVHGLELTERWLAVAPVAVLPPPAYLRADAVSRC